jgi:hypothetical protein
LSTTINEIAKQVPVEQLPDISIKQNIDTQLKPYIDYLVSGQIPADDKGARNIILESQDYIVTDDVYIVSFVLPSR